MSEEVKPESANLEGVVDLPVPRICCPRHLEVFRAKFPAGYLPFSLMGIQYLLEQDGYFEHELRQAEASGLDRKAAMEKVFDAKPVCCRLPSRVLLEYYRKAGCLLKGDPVFPEAKCFNCRKVDAGAPYRIAHLGGTVQQIPHVCLRCVVYFMEPN